MWSLGVVFILFIGMRNLLFCINYSCELDMLVILTLFVCRGMDGRKPPSYFYLFICLSCGKWLGIVGHEKIPTLMSSCCALHQMLLATEQWGYGASPSHISQHCAEPPYTSTDGAPWSSMVAQQGPSKCHSHVGRMAFQLVFHPLRALYLAWYCSVWWWQNSCASQKYDTGCFFPSLDCFYLPMSGKWIHLLHS